MKNDLFLDIESVARPKAEIRASLPPFDSKSVKLGNASKPDTVAAIIAKAEAEYGDDIVESAALSPVYGRIAIVGMMTGDTFLQPAESWLKTTWEHLRSGIMSHNQRIIGWGIKRFDLPFMVRRSLALGINVPPCIWRPARYGFSDNILDLEEIWKSLCGLAPAQCVSLASVLAELGFPAKSGSGADFGKLWATDRDAALAYNRTDLECEAALAERLGV